MSLLALLAALAGQYAYPPPDRRWLDRLYGRLSLSVAKRLNAGDRNSGILGWVVLMTLVLAPMALVTWIAASIHPIEKRFMVITVCPDPRVRRRRSR